MIRDDLSNLVDVCNDLLGSDPLASVRNETKIYYLGDFPDENYLLMGSSWQRAK